MLRNRTLLIPLDRRAMCGAVWLAAFLLALLDSRDDQVGVLALWSGMLALVAAVWTIGLLLAWSRGVLLEVMSFEHRQQTPSLNDPTRGHRTLSSL